VSSHLLSEVAQSVDDVVVISHGVLKASGPLEQVLGSPEGPVTRVRAVDPDRLAALLTERGAALEDGAGAGTLLVRGGPELVGDVAAEHGIALRELVPVSRSLEEAFFALTGEEG
jgi:ABC-2 type transport system ATP-binding protein